MKKFIKILVSFFLSLSLLLAVFILIFSINANKIISDNLLHNGSNIVDIYVDDAFPSFINDSNRNIIRDKIKNSDNIKNFINNYLLYIEDSNFYENKNYNIKIDKNDLDLDNIINNSNSKKDVFKFNLYLSKIKKTLCDTINFYLDELFQNPNIKLSIKSLQIVTSLVFKIIVSIYIIFDILLLIYFWRKKSLIHISIPLIISSLIYIILSIINYYIKIQTHIIKINIILSYNVLIYIYTTLCIGIILFITHFIIKNKKRVSNECI